MIDAAALHRAADRVGDEAGTPAMDALASAGAEFLRTSDLGDEFGTAFTPEPQSIGYGIMLGYLAATEDRRDPEAVYRATSIRGRPPERDEG